MGNITFHGGCFRGETELEGGISYVETDVFRANKEKRRRKKARREEKKKGREKAKARRLSPEARAFLDCASLVGLLSQEEKEIETFFLFERERTID